MNLGLLAPGPRDGTSFYRAFGPLSYLSRAHGVRLITAPEWDWSNLLQCDAVFLQRPFAQEHGMVARWCNGLNVPLWVDYDDLYTSFPDWLAAQQQTYGSPAAVEVMQFCLRAASLVTASTPALAEELRKVAPETRVEVVPNAFPSYLWPFSDAPRRKVVTWRGSGGHMGDLDPHVESLQAIAKRERENGWEFHWLGKAHYKLAQAGTVHPFIDLFSYMEKFMELAPSVHIVPLEDCLFNRCKSNAAWIEATAAGAVVVAPDLPEWRRPGVVRYGFADGSMAGTYANRLESALEFAMESPEAVRMDLLGQSRKFILENLRLATVNERRWELLQELVGG